MTLFLNMLVKRVAMRYYFVLQEIPTHRSVGKIDQFTNGVNCVQSSRYAKWAYVEIFIVAINWNRGKKLCFAQLFPSYAEKRDKRAKLPNENEEKKITETLNRHALVRIYCFIAVQMRELNCVESTIEKCHHIAYNANISKELIWKTIKIFNICVVVVVVLLLWLWLGYCSSCYHF